MKSVFTWFGLIPSIIIPTISLGQWSQTGYGVIGGNFTSIKIQGTQVVAGSLNSGVYISQDLGLSWTRSNNGFPNHLINSLDTRIDLWALATSDGIYITEDDGQTWATAGLQNQMIHSVVIHDDVLICGSMGIYRSEDKGQSWQNVLPGDIGGSIYEIADAGSYMLARNSLGTIFKSSDDGASWMQIADLGLQLSSITAEADVAYAVTAEGLKKSTTGGEFWNSFPGYAGFNKVILKDGILLAGGFGGIYKADDLENGMWNPAIIPNVVGNISAFSIEEGKLFAATSSGGILFSNDAGINWENRNNNLVNNQVKNLISVGTTLYACNDKQVLTSEDEGETWKVTFSPPSIHDQVSELYVMGNILYVAVGTLGIYRSSDGGLTWEVNSVWPEFLTVQSITSQGTTLFAGTNSGIYKSNDNGDTWVLAGFSGSLILEIFATENSLFAMGSMGNYRSHNQGSDWQPFSSFVYSIASKWQMIEFNNMLYLATDFGLFSSSDNGTTWTLFEEFGFGGIDHISSNGEDLFVCSMGEVYSYSVNSIQVITPSPYSFSGYLADYQVKSVYPASNRIFIGVSILSSTYGSIWALQGNLVPKIESFTPERGSMGTTISLTGLNFNPILNQTHVRVNGSFTPVTSATSNTLTFQTPNTTGNATIEVQVNNMVSKAINKFKSIPKIVSITPQEGSAHTYITIEGYGLNVIDVLFDETTAYTYFKSNSKITASVPVNATSGPIRLIMSDTTLISDLSFKVLPTIESFYPRSGKPGEEVTITGTGFGNAPGQTKVKFNGKDAIEISGNNTSVRTLVPAGAQSGSISIEVDGAIAKSNDPFVILPLPIICSELTKPTIEEIQNNLLISSYNTGNRWFLNGEVIPNESSNMLLVPQSGTYQVQAWIDGCPTPLSNPFPVIITAAESVGDFTVFPVPARDWIKISLPAELLDQPLVVSIHNLVGEREFQSTQNGQEQLEIDIQNLSIGLHIIEISYQKKLYRSKLIIN